MFKPIVKNVTTGQELLWREIKIKKSLDEICHSLELEIPASERLKVKRHHRLKVYCKNSLINNPEKEGTVTTVLVDHVTANADTGKNSIMVFGRSPARDIIDSSWSDYDDDYYDDDSTLREIVIKIGEKFKIICDTFPPDQPDPTDPVSHFAFENESPWTRLTDKADGQGYILTSNQAGNLYLWKVASSDRSEGFNLIEGLNIKGIKWTENGSEQFHEYIVKGGGYDSVKLIDDTCPGSRTLTIDIEDPFVSEKEMQRRAETEKNRRKETKTIVSVSGWGLTDEQIKRLGTTTEKELFWFPNSLIPVRLPSMGLKASLLISEVEYTATAETMGCDITLVNREMYS
jgi:prophage tail gpP-like protein